MTTIQNMTFAEVIGAEEEAAAFSEGATVVIRLDLMPGYVAPVDPHDEEDPPTDPVDPPANTGLIEFTGLPAIIPDAPANQLGDGDFTLTFNFKLRHALSGHTFMISKGVAGSLPSAWYIAILSGTMLAFSPIDNGVVPPSGVYVPYPHLNDFTNEHEIELKRVAGVTTLSVDGVVMGTYEGAIYSGVGDMRIGAWQYTSANCQVHDVSNVRLVK